MKEKALSDKIVDLEAGDILFCNYIHIDDIKESLWKFIQIIKNNKNDDLNDYNKMLLSDLKEIFGEKLTGNIIKNNIELDEIEGEILNTLIEDVHLE